jgi:putative ABC transport system permease protein
MPAVRDALKAIDPTLPIYDVRPLSMYADTANATRQFTMRLAVIFAIVAVLLASVGIYGVVAYTVAIRHREFGVRRALGAQTLQVLALVAREGAVLLSLGVAAGTVFAAITAWAMQSLLFGIGPWDPATYAIALPVLLLAGALACLLPARRAIKANPVDALRAE